MAMTNKEIERWTVELAMRKWKDYAGCSCKPKVVDKVGYDLECSHRHVELKGTTSEAPSFRYMTKESFDVARRDSKFVMWIITNIGGKAVFHIVPREDVVRLAKIDISWSLPLSKGDLETFKKKAEAVAQKNSRRADPQD